MRLKLPQSGVIRWIILQGGVIISPSGVIIPQNRRIVPQSGQLVLKYTGIQTCNILQFGLELNLFGLPRLLYHHVLDFHKAGKVSALVFTELHGYNFNCVFKLRNHGVFKRVYTASCLFDFFGKHLRALFRFGKAQKVGHSIVKFGGSVVKLGGSECKSIA